MGLRLTTHLVVGIRRPEHPERLITVALSPEQAALFALAPDEAVRFCMLDGYQAADTNTEQKALR